MDTLITDNKALIDMLPGIVRENLNTEISDVRFIGGGSFGKVFSCNSEMLGEMALKIYRVQGMQHREADHLRLLSNVSGINVPKVHLVYESKNIALMAMSFIEGENVLDPIFLLKSKHMKKQFAESTVDWLLKIHSVKGKKYGFTAEGECESWLEFFRKNVVEPQMNGLKELMEKGKYNHKSYKLLEEATRLFFDIANEPDNPVLIHSDLNIMNIMADKSDLSLTGFIDPGKMIWADREYDLFQFLNMWGNCYGLYDTYKERFKLSEHCDFKVAYYAALNEASCRLAGGLIMPVWEFQCNRRLIRAMKKYK